MWGGGSIDFAYQKLIISGQYTFLQLWFSSHEWFQIIISY
jgi:hypothetical protein